MVRLAWLLRLSVRIWKCVRARDIGLIEIKEKDLENGEWYVITTRFY
jgi:hypothetical protein